MKGIPFTPSFRPQPKPEKKEKKSYQIPKQSEKAKAKNDEKKEMAIELDKFCKQWYLDHPTKRCYECDSRIIVYTKMNGHHLIPRRDADKYNIDISLNAENLVLLDLTCHSKCETNIEFAPKTKALTEETYKKFEKYLI